MMKIKKVDSSKDEIITKFMEPYNFVIIQLDNHQIIIGRPIVPLINKVRQYWKACFIRQALRYYATSKQQIEVDLWLRETANEPDFIATKERIEEANRESWDLHCSILESKQHLPHWLIAWLDDRIERYYEKTSKTE